MRLRMVGGRLHTPYFTVSGIPSYGLYSTVMYPPLSPNGSQDGYRIGERQHTDDAVFHPLIPSALKGARSRLFKQSRDYETSTDATYVSCPPCARGTISGRVSTCSPGPYVPLPGHGSATCT